jgi:hypothetical protein
MSNASVVLYDKEWQELWRGTSEELHEALNQGHATV